MRNVTGVLAVMVLTVAFVSGCGNVEKSEPESVEIPAESPSTTAPQKKMEVPQIPHGHSHEGHSH